MTHALRALARERPLWLAIMGIGWAAAFVVGLLVAAVPAGASLSPAAMRPEWVAAVLAGAAGAFLLERRLANGHNELGLIPFGSIGMSAVPALLGAVWLFGALDGVGEAWARRVGLAAIALAGAFLAWFSVPLYRFLRDRVGPPAVSVRRTGTVVVASGFAIVAVIVWVGLRRLGLDPAHVLVVLGLMNAAVALFIYRLLPEFLFRFLAWLLVHGFYRLDREGLDHVPETGPAVVICNHVSFADAIVIMAACTRPIRFVMDHRIFRTPILSFVFRHSRAIPIAPAREDPALLEAAYDEVARALADGELVGLFPEGAITRTGEVEVFRGGLLRIVSRNPVHVVPMALSGLWGSLFSRRFRGLARFVPKGVLPRIRLRAGAPVAPAEVRLEVLREMVIHLRGTRR